MRATFIDTGTVTGTSRSVLLAAAVIAGMLVCATAWIGWRDYQDIRQGAVESLTQNAQMVAGHTDRTLEATELSLEMLTRRFALMSWADIGGLLSAQNAIEEAATRLPQVGEIWLIDQNGYLRALSDDPDPAELDLFDRKYWRVHGVDFHDGPYISGEIRDRLKGRLISVISLPVYAGSHGFRGVVAASLTPAYYGPLLRSAVSCSACATTIVHEDGRVLAGNLPGNVDTARLDRAISQAISNRSPAFLPSERRGDGASSIVSIHPSENYPLAIVSSLPAETVLTRWVENEANLFAIAVVALILFGVGTWRLSRSAAEQERHAVAAQMNAEAFAEARAEAERQREAEARARNEAADANRAKSDFLAMMSHELRTPLNAILGFSEVIAHRTFGPQAIDRYAGYAEDIHRSGQHLLSLINDILDLSKIESDRFVLDPEEFDLSDTVQSCIDLVNSRDDRPHTPVVYDSGVCCLSADRRAVKQILLNLIGNAVKFTPHGEVRVTAQSDGVSVVIEVSDTGPGMEAEDVERALEPFGQVDTSVSRRHEGTGLGLPIVERLTRLHGGRLEIDSVPNQGTCVRVTLPSSQSASDTAGADPKRGEASVPRVA